MSVKLNVKLLDAASAKPSKPLAVEMGVCAVVCGPSYNATDFSIVLAALRKSVDVKIYPAS